MHIWFLKKLDRLVAAIFELNDAVLSFVSWWDIKTNYIVAVDSLNKILPILDILLIQTGLTLYNIGISRINVEDLLFGSFFSEFV